ncbi:MAG TPA: pseudouridine synthase, partial [Deinococcales bacterium]|nr:pseudouridine synthase [Deinococcales bacterium]
LLLTTDGDLTLRLTHPRYEHEKEYWVWTAPPPTARDLQALRRGVSLEDGPSRPDWADLDEGGIRMQLHEGRNRQVRRTMEALGFRVRQLVRTRVGALTLRGLRPGEWVELGERDVQAALERLGR